MKSIDRRQFVGAGIATIAVAGACHFALAQGENLLSATAGSRIRDKRPTVHTPGLRFGAYDPHGDFAEQANVTTEALFMPWEDVDLSSLPAADAYALQRKRNLLITVEPWSWDENFRLTSGELQTRILNGTYDRNMREIAHLIGQLKSPAVVRWAQEMEDRESRFSWAGWRPDAYITAYRRMMDIVRKEAPKAQLMWSPKGVPGLRDYYPGSNYVDYVGMSVFGLEAFDRIAHGNPRSFSDNLLQGYGLVEEFSKPVWVAELGYEGGDGYLTAWMGDVTRDREEFPLLEEVVYFNDHEVHPWPYNLGKPDWRVVRTGSLG